MASFEKPKKNWILHICAAVAIILVLISIPMVPVQNLFFPKSGDYCEAEIDKLESISDNYSIFLMMRSYYRRDERLWKVEAQLKNDKFEVEVRSKSMCEGIRTVTKKLERYATFVKE